MSPARVRSRSCPLRLALAVLTGGCCASASTHTNNATPPHSCSAHDDACEHAERPAGAGNACTVDSDCALCHDGSNCGTVVTAKEYARRGSDCAKPDAAQCECASVHCCTGQCVTAVWCARD